MSADIANLDAWKQINPYSMKKGDYTIVKYFDGVKHTYGLFKGKEEKAMGYFRSFEEAKNFIA